ncbi:MAG: methyltransferase domain-containing protein, partial [Bacteroidales bacterium]|nr:methyltransferase domain-containing protein [Bacteroidales bacterium]
LPFDDETFDLVTAFETIYFWPGITDCYRQVRRVLRNGGRFMIVNESDGTDPWYNSWEDVIGSMHTYTAEEIEADLKAAGFSSISITRDERRFLRVIAIK